MFNSICINSKFGVFQITWDMKVKFAITITCQNINSSSVFYVKWFTLSFMGLGITDQFYTSYFLAT